MDEIWVDVKGYEGEFQVSNTGKIKSLARYVNTGGGGRRLICERIRALGPHTQGYQTITFKATERPWLIHRIVAQHFIPNPENKPFVNHKDGNKHNNHVSNLEWATRQENEDHAYGTGLKNSTGSSNTMSKLNEEKVKLIKVLGKLGFSARGMAIDFGVHAATIQRILSGAIWKHVAIK